MRSPLFTISIILLLGPLRSSGEKYRTLQFNFCGTAVEIPIHSSVEQPLGPERNLLTLQAFSELLLQSDHSSLLSALSGVRQKEKLDDWMFYQLVRQVAQQISAKSEDYYRYTLYKWFLLRITGYDPLLRFGNSRLLFYVRSEENLYNIPFYIRDGKQYVCLNFHDYNNDIPFGTEQFDEIAIDLPEQARNFSYRITHIPEFSAGDYQEKDISFQYGQQTYHFTVKVNPEIKTIFRNYPSLDYGLMLNIPMSRQTYETLIPLLRSNVREMELQEGIDYLMRFTRYAFVYETDQKIFGSEKRLSPEQTLLYEQSDCEDRVSLFYCLVKEIYNLPMIVLSFPEHITIAVKLDKPVGKPVVYNGEAYTVCEPTPQKKDLLIGQLMPDLKHQPFEVVYAYSPLTK